MSSFPFLQLPLVPLTFSLKCLNPIELFTLSQCSRKVSKHVKLAGTQNFRIGISLGDNEISINDYKFEVRKNSSKELAKYEAKNDYRFDFNGKKMTVPGALSPDKNDIILTLSDEQFDGALNPDEKYRLITFWNDQFTGLRAILSHFQDVFGCKVGSFNSGILVHPDKVKIIIGEILKKQNEIQSLCLWNLIDGIVQNGVYHPEPTVLTDDYLKWIFDSLKTTEWLMLSNRPTENFKYTFKTFPRFAIIYDSFWFTLENLLSIGSCEKVDLYRSNMNNQDLDVFMNSWKTMKFPKLRELIVVSKNLNENKPIAGSIVNFKNRVNNQIKRVDGVIGTLYLRAEKFTLYFSTE